MTTTLTCPAVPTEQTPEHSDRPRLAAGLRLRWRRAREARRDARALARAVAYAVTPAQRDELLLLHRLNMR